MNESSYFYYFCETMKNAGNNIFPIFDELLKNTEKEQLLKQKSFTVWMTGLSGSGKSTVAKGLERYLHEHGFLQQILEKHWKDITRAILFTSLIFSLIHMNPYWFIQIYILGILLGFLAWKTNSVIPPLILHGINNGMAMFFSFTKIESNHIYIFKDHVAPWFIFFSVYAVFKGFKGINQIK